MPAAYSNFGSEVCLLQTGVMLIDVFARLCVPAADYNFDSPDAFDKEAILKCMRELKVGEGVGGHVAGKRQCRQCFGGADLHGVACITGARARRPLHAARALSWTLCHASPASLP